jgi:DNA replication protein DnaC
VVFLGPPGTGKTHLSIGLGIRACQADHRVTFATAAERVARLADAHTAGKLQDELIKLARIPSAKMCVQTASVMSRPFRR